MLFRLLRSGIYILSIEQSNKIEPGPEPEPGAQATGSPPGSTGGSGLYRGRKAVGSRDRSQAPRSL